jgi:hypothetical protein|tara:strand:- start:216 stop:485 length:270 start_codon:yes stop_codon:yes gene_type:complete
VQEADSEARLIRTVDDVRRLLESPPFMFFELLDCVEVCRIENNVELRHHCAELALGQTLEAHNVRIPRVEIAAEEIIHAFLVRPRRLWS